MKRWIRRLRGFQLVMQSSPAVPQFHNTTVVHIATVLHCHLLLQHTKTTTVLISNLLPMSILGCSVAMGTTNNGIKMTVQMAIQLATSLVRALTPSYTAKTRLGGSGDHFSEDDNEDADNEDADASATDTNDSKEEADLTRSPGNY